MVDYIPPIKAHFCKWGEELRRQHRPGALLAMPDFMQPMMVRQLVNTH